MAIVGVAGDVAVEGCKRRGYYGHGTKERVDAVLVITMAVTGGSRTFPLLQAGWPDENWKTEINYLLDLSNRGCSSITLLLEVSPERTEDEGEEGCAGHPSLEIGLDYDWWK